MLIIGAIIIGAVGYVSFLLFDFKRGISTTKSVVSKDSDSLIGQVEKVELSPWPIDDIDLLSRIGQSDLAKKLFGDIESGVLFSIYHEPILAFASKKYNLDNTRALVLRFNSVVYSIMPISTGAFEVTKAGDKFAEIVEEDLSINTPLNHIKINKQDGRSLIPVTFNDKIKLMINDQEVDDSDQTRALVSKEPLSEVEGELFIIILAFGLINQII